MSCRCCAYRPSTLRWSGQYGTDPLHQSTREVGTGGQAERCLQRAPQNAVVQDVRLPVEGADVQLVQLPVVAGDLGGDVQPSPQHRFDTPAAYVVPAQSLPQQP